MTDRCGTPWHGHDAAHSTVPHRKVGRALIPGAPPWGSPVSPGASHKALVNRGASVIVEELASYHTRNRYTVTAVNWDEKVDYA